MGKYESDNTTHACGFESPGNTVTPVNVNEVKPINKGEEQIGFELVEIISRSAGIKDALLGM